MIKELLWEIGSAMLLYKIEEHDIHPKRTYPTVESQSLSPQCCIQNEISIESEAPRSSIKLKALTLGRYPLLSQGVKSTIFQDLTFPIL